MTLSREVRAIIAYVESTGVLHRVTSTTNHAVLTASGNPSRHRTAGTDGEGLAVDFAAPKAGDAAGLTAIYRAFLGRTVHLRELIYWGPAVDVLIRRGLKVVPMTYGTAVLATHRDHVHVSVDKGTFLDPLEVPVVDNADLPNLTDVKFFVPIADSTGICTGYYMVSSTGEVHGHGPGAVYHGRSEVVSAS